METIVVKITLVEELFHNQVIFCSSLICSKLAQSNLNQELISTISQINYEVAKQIIKEEMIANNMYLGNYLELGPYKIMQTYKIEMLN